MTSAALTLKQITLELGSNGFVIVLVDPKEVEPGVFEGIS
jgi:hypothetical protein